MKRTEAIAWLAFLSLYLAQGGLYSFAGLPGKLFFFILCLFGLLNFLRILVKKPSLRTQIGVLIVLYLVLNSTLRLNQADGALKYDFIKKLIFLFAIYFSSEYYFKMNYITGLALTRYALLGLIFAIGVFFSWQEHEIERLGRDIVTNNQGYLILSYLPLVLLITRRFVRIVLTLTIVFFVILSIKRGAIAIMIIALLFQVIVELNQGIYQSVLVDRINKSAFLLTLVLIIFYSPYLVDYSGVLGRLEEGLGARPDNFGALIFYIKHQASTMDILVGTGPASTALLTPERALAHNDILEIVVDFGLIGLVLYTFWCTIISLSLPLGLKEQYNSINYIIVLSFIGISSYSMWVININTANYLLVIFYSLYERKRSKENPVSIPIA